MARSKGRSPLNIRLIGGAFVIFGVGAIVFTQMMSTTSTYSVAVAAQTINAGSVLAPEDYTFVTGTGTPPVAGLIGPTTVDELGLLGRYATNTIYAGSLLQVSDFYVPQIDGASPAPEPHFARGLSDLLTAQENRGLVLIAPDDPTSTYAHPGDWLDIYWVDGDGLVAKRLMTKKVVYAVRRSVPDAGVVSDEWWPQGTSYLLDDMSAQEIQDLQWAAANGELRVSIGRPDAQMIPTTVQTDAAYFANTYRVTVGGYTPDGVEASPAPSAGLPGLDASFAPLPEWSPEPSVPGLPPQDLGSPDPSFGLPAQDLGSPAP